MWPEAGISLQSFDPLTPKRDLQSRLVSRASLQRLEAWMAAQPEWTVNLIATRHVIRVASELIKRMSQRRCCDPTTCLNALPAARCPSSASGPMKSMFLRINRYSGTGSGVARNQELPAGSLTPAPRSTVLDADPKHVGDCFIFSLRFGPAPKPQNRPCVMV